ncbi:MAG TPA: YceI family protein [Gaiellaceae bacterium]|nr:YceI family protein [Gaiellaceae bacterium]
MSVIESTGQIAPAGTWAADPVHSNVSFEVAYAGVNTFRGSFTDFSAVLVAGDEPSLQGSARVASVDVKDEQLGGHLQTPDFFDAERYPEIEFRATDLRHLDGDRVQGSGELTIKGETRSITIDGAVAPAPSVDPFGRERLGLRLEATIDRTDFGVSWNAPNQGGGDYLGTDVKLIAELALVRQEA